MELTVEDVLHVQLDNEALRVAQCLPRRRVLKRLSSGMSYARLNSSPNSAATGLQVTLAASFLEILQTAMKRMPSSFFLKAIRWAENKSTSGAKGPCFRGWIGWREPCSRAQCSVGSARFRQWVGIASPCGGRVGNRWHLQNYWQGKTSDERGFFFGVHVQHMKIGRW